MRWSAFMNESYETLAARAISRAEAEAKKYMGSHEAAFECGILRGELKQMALNADRHRGNLSQIVENLRHLVIDPIRGAEIIDRIRESIYREHDEDARTALDALQHAEDALGELFEALSTKQQPRTQKEAAWEVV
jgi:hypothetical protein